jgi:3-oxoacyl-[acyl-carrier-protein] synthase-1
MPKVTILNREIYTALGDTKGSIAAIKSGKTWSGFKEVQSATSYARTPYFAFEQAIPQTVEAIEAFLLEMVSKLIVSLSTKERASTVLIIGTSIVDWHLVEAINATLYTEEEKSYSSAKRSIDSYAQNIAKYLGLNNFTMTINTACTSSANAVLEASNLISSGLFEHAIVLGLELFSPIMSSGFYAMDLIAKEKISPFDKQRDGLVLGEALGGMLLGTTYSPWSLEGGFSNCDSETITSVSQSGKECLFVMQEALKASSLEPDEITALKAHATGSYSNDIAEMNALSNLFSDTLTFTALKPYIGHTIGASGVTEMVLLMQAVDEGFIPKTLNCETPIFERYKPLSSHMPCQEGTFMCNYFGFGGNNTSLIIKKER